MAFPLRGAPKFTFLKTTNKKTGGGEPKFPVANQARTSDAVAKPPLCWSRMELAVPEGPSGEVQRGHISPPCPAWICSSGVGVDGFLFSLPVTSACT